MYIPYQKSLENAGFCLHNICGNPASALLGATNLQLLISLSAYLHFHTHHRLIHHHMLQCTLLQVLSKQHCHPFFCCISSQSIYTSYLLSQGYSSFILDFCFRSVQNTDPMFIHNFLQFFFYSSTHAQYSYLYFL